MSDHMTEKEKDLAIQIFEIVRQLPKEDQQHLVWIGQGILFASTGQCEFK